MAGTGHLRISDQDRDGAAAAIREHYAAGRLDSSEFEERLQGVMTARTERELNALTADLPLLPVSAPQARALTKQRRAEIRRRAVHNAGGSLTPFLVCTVVWAVTGADLHFFWPALLLLGPVALLARVGWALYGPSPDLDSAERELKSHRRRHVRRHRYR